MLNEFTSSATRILLKTGSTDFRKQIDGLSLLVTAQLKLDPFEEECVFIFCNKRRNSLKILRYDRNGFILATKKLLDGMKFQWPRTAEEVEEITEQQLNWLFDGLEIEQRKAHHPLEFSARESCF
ncbi:MAG: IS66 family insertion sequence element accessory protein TnpB [Eubacteriales bacterium]